MQCFEEAMSGTLTLQVLRIILLTLIAGIMQTFRILQHRDEFGISRITKNE